MIYIKTATIIKKNSEEIDKPEFADIFISESELKLYKKLCYEEIEKELGKRFDDPKKQRETNYDITFTFISDE